MKSKQFVCGNSGAPVAGQTLFQSEFLKGVLVDYIIVNNVNENQLNPSPDFTHDYVEGIVSRGSNTWQLADKLIIVYSECLKCNQ